MHEIPRMAALYLSSDECSFNVGDALLLPRQEGLLRIKQVIRKRGFVSIYKSFAKAHKDTLMAVQ